MNAQSQPASVLSKEEFLRAVLSRSPKLAVFDCDGTLWSGDSGESFFRWELARGVLPPEVAGSIKQRHAAYLAGNVSEDDMCGEMVTIHAGMDESALRDLAREFFRETFVQNIFPEMLDLVRTLRASGCDVWAVSSTNQWVVEEGMRYFDVPGDHVLAASVIMRDGAATGDVIRVPSGPGKTQAIREVVRRDPDAVFGNSRWDLHMLAIAKHAYAINPFSELEQAAREHGWPIYWPDGTRPS